MQNVLSSFAYNNQTLDKNTSSGKWIKEQNAMQILHELTMDLYYDMI
jgi:hypothetical protein